MNPTGPVLGVEGRNGVEVEPIAREGDGAGVLLGFEPGPGQVWGEGVANERYCLLWSAGAEQSLAPAVVQLDDLVDVMEFGTPHRVTREAALQPGSLGHAGLDQQIPEVVVHLLGPLAYLWIQL